MNCREFTEFLHDYLLGGLLAEVRAEFDRHLAECPWCVAYLDSYKKTMQLARTAFAAAERIQGDPRKPPYLDGLPACATLSW